MKGKPFSFLWMTVAGLGLAFLGFSYHRHVTPLETVESLQEKQAQIKQVIRDAMPATVAVSDGTGSGSGVIVSEDGLVLTAAHVLMTGGQEFSVTFADGRQVSATALGKALDVDAGMLKIDDPGPWPFVPMGDLSQISRGSWCIAMGYPGGYQLGRTPPVRVGRVLANAPTVILSDSALIGGDSGGPLFNLAGEVIGIHSSIGASVDQNRHVPITLFRDNWERLKAGEEWGRLGARVELDPNRPMLGIQMQQTEDGPIISGFFEGSPAAQVGLKVEDRIISVDGQAVETTLDIIQIVTQKRVGEVADLVVNREGQEVSFQVPLARKSELQGIPSE